MIEANEDITLITDRQLRDVEQGQAQARAIAEGRETHPALLAQNQPSADPAPETPQTVAQTLQPEPNRQPSDPDAAFRHIRLAAVAVIVLILFFLWLRQRTAGTKH